MGELSQDSLRAALAQVAGPGGDNIIDAGRVQGLAVRRGNVSFSLDVSGLDPSAVQALQQAAEAAARAVSGVESVACVATAHREAGKKTANREVPKVFERIGAVVAVASGKGGVGKSTVAVNLALALQKAGLAVGLLDADIYGPSIPQLLNIVEKPQMTDDKKLVPIDRFGVRAMSIGFLVPPEQAMIWRGPMVQSALLQMLNDVAWPRLDILVMDLPPGTGDIQLTMAQRIPVSGAVIVSTPGALALADVTRAVGMFEKTGVPVLGLVENMAYMTMPSGEKIFPFGEGGAVLAQKTDLPCLARLPFDTDAPAAAETGKPVVADNTGPLPPLFLELAEKVKNSLNVK